MPIGTSLGAFYEDGFHQATAQWDPKYDDNEVTPNQLYQNKQLNDVEMTELGGLPVAQKSQMPFPDNKNPDTDFTSRFGNLPPSGIMNDLKPQQPPPLMRKISDIYDTPLTPEQQTEFSKKYSPQDTHDYDMQGFYQDNPNVDPHTDGTHYPDTYKKPNHPTFSDESQYNGVAGNQGGTWGKDDAGKDTFTPGKTNLEHYTPDQLQDYFKKVEPDVKLILPKGPQSDNSSLIHRVSDVYEVNPMNATENGIIPLNGAPERVGKAALQFNGETFTGENHGFAFQKLMNKYPENTNYKTVRDGFMTTHGRFISREDAFTTAKNQDQIHDKVLPSLTEDSTMLLSEDLK